MLKKKSFKEDKAPLPDEDGAAETTKRALCHHIKTTLEEKLGIPDNAYLILVYGSAYFGADVQGTSDLDLLLVLKHEALGKFGNDPDQIRKNFFFRELVASLLETDSNDALYDAYAIENARNPIIKLKWADLLSDLSCALV
jgi:hypothetical protein